MLLSLVPSVLLTAHPSTLPPDAGTGGQLAQGELGVEASSLPTSVVLFTHYEDGTPRVGGERGVYLHAWRRNMKKKAKSDPSLMRLATLNPPPEVFADQLAAFLHKHLAKYEVAAHGPMEAGREVGLAGSVCSSGDNDDDDDEEEKDGEEYSDEELFGEAGTTSSSLRDEL